MAVKIQVEVFWVATPPSSGWRWRQQGPLKCCILLQYYMVSEPRRLTSPPQIDLNIILPASSWSSKWPLFKAFLHQTSIQFFL